MYYYGAMRIHSKTSKTNKNLTKRCDKKCDKITLNYLQHSKNDLFLPLKWRYLVTQVQCYGFYVSLLVSGKQWTHCIAVN